MALIVEDGTGKADAESYATVAQLRAYCEAFGLSLGVAATDDTRAEQLLRQATEYLGGYGAFWSGARATAEQALDWPRTGATMYHNPVPADVVPNPVQAACSRLAQKALAGPLTKDQGREKIKVKVGPLETEYAQGVGQQTYYVDVGRILAPLLMPATSANSIPLRRT